MADGIDYTHFADIKKSPELKLYTAVSLGIAYVAMNTEKEGTLADPKVRIALQHAVNEDRIFKTVFYGYGEKARQTFPPTGSATIPASPAMSSTRKRRRSFWPKPVTPMASQSLF